MSDRKSDCRRNSISTTGNIDMLHFSGKLNSGGIERDSGANTRDSGVNGHSDFFENTKTHFWWVRAEFGALDGILRFGQIS